MGQRLKGESVILIKKTQTGTDAFGAPVYEESKIAVENVLVGQPESQDITDEINLSGKRIEYVLGIPKGDDHDWFDTAVEVRGERYRTIGRPLYGTPENMPLWWSGKVAVERYG